MSPIPSPRRSVALNQECTELSKPVDSRQLGKPTIQKFPAELLLMIFKHMVETEVVRDLAPWKLYRSYKKWLPASSTCKYWREIATTSPSLWRVIDVGSTGEVLGNSLDKFLPDDVTLEITFHDPAPIPFFVSTLHKNAHRIEKLIIPELDDRDILSGLTSIFCWSSMPKLKELWVNTVPRTRDHDFQPFIRPDLVPNLQAVHFTHLRVNWGSPIIPNLRALSLGCSPAQDRCYLDQFLSIMATCQRLEFLKIDRAFPIFGEDQSKMSIALPRLREVYLTADDPREVHHVLSHIRFDPSVNIDVHIRINVDRPNHPFGNTGIASVIPYDAACIPVLEAATRVVVRDEDFECWGPGGYGRLALTFVNINMSRWGYAFPDLLRDLGDLLSRAPVTELTIHQDWSECPDPIVIHFFVRDFPRITAFTHYGLEPDQSDPLFIFSPYTVCPGRVVPPSFPDTYATSLPNLCNLRLDLRYWHDGFLIELRDCLRARSDAGFILDDVCISVPRIGNMDGFEAERQLVAAELEELVRGDFILKLTD
ncbi:hypothetical protein L226DRAFT_616077 [Lentinus tigrinus ALCF2SS1-7]|uniref:F-box domain-containing protein n=1 Tax=Lentinus tigrinus ALCF2SS1-6 TaxID=1328759 RepID=A0A5C2RS31_9APHY|nr:hypothetical protein L227DRAFT_657954 [Lentinus tigrinus ALCF2SS1-6]RPD70562.1 hypothetical protein L226DRAFT_616077 [Lentinus tigrinus ALCF2SS1-7]